MKCRMLEVRHLEVQRWGMGLRGSIQPDWRKAKILILSLHIHVSTCSAGNALRFAGGREIWSKLHVFIPLSTSQSITSLVHLLTVNHLLNPSLVFQL